MAAAAARTCGRSRRPCGRRCARPGSARRWKSLASAGRRSCPCLRHPTARRAPLYFETSDRSILFHPHDRHHSYASAPVKTIYLDGSRLTLEDLHAISDAYATVALDPRAAAAVNASRAVVDTHAAGDAPVYGINTGFGSLAEVKIAKDALGALQRNLLRSHAAGVGEPLSRRSARVAATPPPQPRGERGRAAVAPLSPPHDGAAGQRAGQGLLRHPPRHA